MKNQNINRDNLKKIYDIACSNWKTKLEGYAKRNLFQDDIELSNDEIDEMFNASDDKQKVVLKRFFKRPESIMDKIKSFKDACNYFEVTEKSVFSSTDTKDEIGFKKLKLIIKALNEGWYPNWQNENEYKYYNYFKMKGGLSFWYTHGYLTGTTVPSALTFKTPELAKHCVEIALNEYKDFYE